ARTLRRIAALWIEKFGNYNQAVRPLEELYTLEPTSDAAARLREIYARRRSFRALLELERRELNRLEEPAARRAKLTEMAHLAAERLGDSGEAIALWNRLLELDPYDPDALAQLALLYEREKRYPALIEVLWRQAGRAADTRTQALLVEKIGVLYAER